jgi:hypothetical protein
MREDDVSIAAFKKLIEEVTTAIAGQPLDGALETTLNTRFPADGALFCAIESQCQTGIAAGWMCEREHAGISFGRVINTDPDLAGFSVDVVKMADVVGPHHRHPLGEIDMVMPLDPTARFDESAGGTAIVLYLLPQGKIEFTGRSK